MIRLETAVTAPCKLPEPGPAPIVIEVTRGPIVESRHRVACAVTDADGTVVASWGDVAGPVYPRSSVKLIQALPFLETGAAEGCGAGDAEVALACASHGGEAMHVEAVRAWLHRVGLSEDDLECGVQLPYHEPSMHAMIRAGRAPTAAHNNCSGKHTAMLATARHIAEPTRGYVDAGHPVQRRVVAAIAEMSGCDLADAPVGIDGCSLPNIALPLPGLATAMARLGEPSALPPVRAAACRRIVAAVAANPLMIAGHGRACSRINEELAGRAVVKTGAEGVFAATVPGQGLGVALKVADGASRASEVAIIAVLHRLGAVTETALRALSDIAAPAIINRRGLVVGAIRPGEGAF